MTDYYLKADRKKSPVKYKGKRRRKTIRISDLSIVSGNSKEYSIGLKTPCAPASPRNAHSN